MLNKSCQNHVEKLANLFLQKNNVDLIVKEDGDLKSFHSFPDLFGENDETHGQLITEKSGIWLPMIAVSDEQKVWYLHPIILHFMILKSFYKKFIH